MAGLLQEYVTRQAEARPEASALVHDAERLTYGDLERRSNRLARLLREGGCRRGDRIGLLLPKSPAAIVSMLAALKAGCIYVPVDPESPSARVVRILTAADCRYLLVSRADLPIVRDLTSQHTDLISGRLIWMGSETPPDLGIEPALSLSDSAAMPDSALGSDGDGSDPAHLLFTSGSTGIPKGVMVAHANVTAFVEWANAYCGLAPDDRTSCHSPLHFDLSTWDVYGAFAAGAELHLVPPELNLFPGRLVEFIRSHGLTQWFSVPSVLTYLTRFDAVRTGDFPELKRLLWCGEVFPTPALKYWMERLPHVSFTNLYGPTETTIASSYYTVPAPPQDPEQRIPIGAPCAGEELLILDDARAPVRPGDIGEICIRGAGVTLGYWRDEEKTARAFLPCADRPGERMYTTGDRGFRGPDGLVYCVGRADSQIKSRGHRIELGEIETALHTLAEIGQAAVVARRTDGFGGVEICCAYVPKDRVELSPSQVREGLARLIPKYMLPARWRRLAEFPRNANGKVDRVALVEMFDQEAAGPGT